jgi:hypothetical protein
MAVRLSALRTGRVVLPRNIIFLLLSKPQVVVRPEGLGKLKNSYTSSVLEPATLLLVTLYLNRCASACPNIVAMLN